MERAPSPLDEVELRRRRALRTAWIVAVVAVAVYAAFILSGVVGR